MEKRVIRIDTAEEECIDLSISKTPASQLYLLLQVGLKALGQDLNNGKSHLNQLKAMIGKDPWVDKPGELERMIAETIERLEMGKGIHDTGLKFYQDLQQILKELHSEEKKPSLIIKPNWMG